MKWGALLVAGWLAMNVVVRTSAGPGVAHHGPATADSVAMVPAAASMNDDEGCWQDYVDRATQIYLNLIECVKGNEWYDTFGYLVCELSYEFGAFMAFMRLMACMSL
jgi:hypothetical protein